MRVLADLGHTVVLWGRTAEKARACVDRLGLGGRVAARAWSGLPASVGRGDVVVSMLPASEHAALARLAIENRAHFADTSYVADDVAGLAGAAAAGVVLLAEAGLDPGLDHLLAHELVAEAEQAVPGPAEARFTSYCGGIPAVPDDFRYRFSWAPRGVLTALLNPARFVDDGQERTVDRPWEDVRSHPVGDEVFEVYPNRDSVPFSAQYGFPDRWRGRQFVRGTVRHEGWRDAWEPVFAELRAPDPDRITALADDLAARYPTTATDRDRVVLAVSLTVGDWSGTRVVDLVGDADDSAMAKLVSTPLAAGVNEVVTGRTSAGLHRAAEDAAAVGRVLGFLRGQGITAR
ncbi:saccharopine dehydrogenase NADP-binding domain-containing protein [Actinokineospora sp. PR83]|uniref:saccharopine dehydrogenase C-terminal domain-containing protein n=1 Tax=Actinokineospora sp. PR83 TaxID=2884908 RepID=UPI0027E05BDF|nr:saccharopine dehydrogenase C-terminal domain-containing protein [Actinokineospora sp. PR83]MCG8919041.1 saccharopine dehydrogenase NADP-binding domain-containing protein [Actinokineospora sp. PR83]